MRDCLLYTSLYDLGTTLFMNVVLGTCVLFVLLALISHRKPAGHYIGLGSTLLVGLVVLIGMSIVNIFIQGTVFNIAVSGLGIILFSAYILYDVSLLKYDIQSGGVTCRNDLSIHVLNLYLDFVNILLDLLRIVSVSYTHLSYRRKWFKIIWRSKTKNFNRKSNIKRCSNNTFR